MATRRELFARILRKDGASINVVVRDALLPEDLLIQSMKAEGYRIMTGRDVFPDYDRKIRDYLIRLRTVTQ